MKTSFTLFTVGLLCLTPASFAQYGTGFVHKHDMIETTPETTAPSAVESTELRNVFFDGIDSDRVKESFLRVMKAYDVLHDFEITLVHRKIKSSTMVAQPELSLKALFGGVKRYRIKLATHVRDTEDIRIDQLPDEVLTGWFAHELGHIAHYGPRSNIGMVWYGMKYVFSRKFKRHAEHEADRFAIEHGFHREIIATKRFILEHDLLDDAYKHKIRAFYMSIEDVELCVADEALPLEPVIEM